MKKMLVFPPFYFFATIAANVVFYYLFKEFNRIDFPFNLLGIVAIVSGYYLLSESSAIFTQYETTFALEEPAVFVQERCYRVSRNPMYLGALILIAGQSVLMGNVISLINPVLFFLFVNFLCIPPEETIMEKSFGDRYLRYKKRVRRWL